MSYINYDAIPHLWGLMDCNNFYASCERIFRPDLQNSPIVVLSNNDGCIVARSAEAKALGIPMGEPEFKARAFIKKNNVTVFSSNYALYGDISQRVMQTAEHFVPHLEQYSIDEAFLPFMGNTQIHANDMAYELRKHILQWTGITVSIGLAPTKTLAKLANHIAKKNNGIFSFPTDQKQQDELLANTAVQDIWGIGRNHAKKLHMHGIHNAKDLRNKDNVWLKKHLTISGLHTAMELRGRPCIVDTTQGNVRQTLISSRSFGTKIYKKDDLAEAISTFTTNAVMRLRREKLLAKSIAVHIRSSKHMQNNYVNSVHMTLIEPTANTPTFLKMALHGLDSIFKDNIPYAKAGVMLYDFCPTHAYQKSLLSICNPQAEIQHERTKKLMTAVDNINAKYGRNTLIYASQGINQQAPWRMQQKFLSNRFTTKWTELPIALCK